MAVDAGPMDGVAMRRRPLAALWWLAREARNRLGWGVADQSVSSLTNFAVSIYVARTLGAVEFGAFSLAYVTYSVALNASRGLSTEPFLVRKSGVGTEEWRQAAKSASGTALAVGLVAGACTLCVAAVLHGAPRPAFFALGLCLPGLMLQDSWRYIFFAHRRGVHALVNDTVWALTLLPGLAVLRLTGERDVFWYILAWGASAAMAAAVGPFQAKVVPKLSDVWVWVSHHRDLGPRFLVENTANAGSTQLRTYGISLILGLAAVGYVQAAVTLMGPFLVIFFAMGLVALPEAVRELQRSPRHLVVFCCLMAAGLGLLGSVWGAVLWVAFPHGLGHVVLASLWRPTEPLILPLTVMVVGGCAMMGAGIGLHALGAARRSMRAMILASAVEVVAMLVGAAVGGAVGTMRGAAVSGWIGALLFWRELRAGLREVGYHHQWPFRLGGRVLEVSLADPMAHEDTRLEGRNGEPPPGFSIVQRVPPNKGPASDGIRTGRARANTDDDGRSATSARPRAPANGRLSGRSAASR